MKPPAKLHSQAPSGPLLVPLNLVFCQTDRRKITYHWQPGNRKEKNTDVSTTELDSPSLSIASSASLRLQPPSLPILVIEPDGWILVCMSIEASLHAVLPKQHELVIVETVFRNQFLPVIVIVIDVPGRSGEGWVGWRTPRWRWQESWHSGWSPRRS